MNASASGIDVFSIDGPPPRPLADALAAFEAQFTYPLGPGRTFRISHGDDYARFFRAIGNAIGDGRVFVAQRDGAVVGVVGVAIRRLVHPDGRRQDVAYVGDLKVSPAARGSAVYTRLAARAIGWARPRVTAGYGVVMEGTPATPRQYTGRLMIPAFEPIGRIAVLRVPSSNDERAMRDAERYIASPERATAAAVAMLAGRYHGQGGDPALRSEFPPTWLLLPDGTACGRLEDTRRAKRLIGDDGAEMRSAHLASFAWRTPVAAGALIHAAQSLAAARGFPGMFVAVSDADATAVRQSLGALPVVVAPATIYGTGLEPAAPWCVDTSEI